MIVLKSYLTTPIVVMVPKRKRTTTINIRNPAKGARDPRCIVNYATADEELLSESDEDSPLNLFVARLSL
jgi:hypothetical protein